MIINFKDTEIRVNSGRLVETIKNLSPIGGNGLEYIDDVINDFGVVDYNDSLVGIKHLLMILDSALDIYKSLHDPESGKNPDLYREISIEKATLLSLDHLKYVDDAFDAIYSICEDNSSAVIVGANRISLRYAYLIYLWTIKETFVYDGLHSTVTINNYVCGRIDYLALSNNFKGYSNQTIYEATEKIVKVHETRIELNRLIEQFNSELKSIFRGKKIDELLLNYTNAYDKINIDMKYNPANIMFTFEYNMFIYEADKDETSKTILGNVIKFGQSPYYAIFKSLNPDGVYLECASIPFYGLNVDENYIKPKDSLKDINYQMAEYARAFNSNCEILNKISLGTYLTCSEKYHFNVYEFRGKLEKHVQVTRLFRDEYAYMLEHLYYMFMNLRYEHNKHSHKIRSV